MSIIVELSPEVEQLAKAKAEAQGISLEEYLPFVIARTLQQQEWDEMPALPTASWDSAIRRIWDTPEEDAAWKYLEDI